MRPAQALIINSKNLTPEKRGSFLVTQRYLRSMFRKVLVEDASVDIFEEPLYVEDSRSMTLRTFCSPYLFGLKPIVIISSAQAAPAVS